MELNVVYDGIVKGESSARGDCRVVFLEVFDVPGEMSVIVSIKNIIHVPYLDGTVTTTGNNLTLCVLVPV